MVQSTEGCEGGSCHSLSRQDVMDSLETSEAGLTTEQAVERLGRVGPNEIREVHGKPAWLKFLENFYHLFAIMLWVASILAFIGGMPELGWAIIAVIIINAVFSFWQEYKADKATEALKQLIPRKARVIRDGEVCEIEAKDLVPGDVMLLAEGDAISADARLIEESNLRVNNATLTGESEPVRKSASSHAGEGLSLVEMPNLVFSGTSVAYGNGKAVAFATGMDTQFGKIAELTQNVHTELSPLQKEMQKVTQLVAILATVLGIVFFVLGYFVAGLTLVGGFLFAVGIIVANVPEGLLPTVTLSLAMGTQRMADRHALIKRLSSVETLGCTTVICTDKTGTLTKNEMTVRQVWTDGAVIDVTGGGYAPVGEFTRDGRELNAEEAGAVELLVRAAALCNNARLVEPEEDGGAWTILGDPTEAALVVAARKAGFDADTAGGRFRRMFELPFDSVRKRMTTVHRETGGSVAYVKGAPREILDLSTRIATSDGTSQLDQRRRDEIIDQNDRFARDGLRVLAMAYRPLPDDQRDFTPDDTERDLVFIGLMAMMDPPRDEVAYAVKECGTAGIRIIMITGDYGLTAESIARRVGIVGEGPATIVTGPDLEAMDQDQLIEVLAGRNVLFARVSPEHKMRIASALKATGEVVAMTGDGVNDAPALKTADIGVAMGITGTDVAKEAADMILTDDNFASIVNAVEEGRAVYDNIRRFVAYIFTSNIPEIVPFILFVVFDIPLPLTIMQILAIDLGTDMLPALALGTEAPEPGIMNRPPRPRDERMLNWPLLGRAYFYLGPIQTVAAMSAYFLMYFQNGWRIGLPLAATGIVYVKATTMTLGAVVTTQIGNGFAQRTTRQSIFKIGLFSNRFLLWGMLSSIVAIFALVYIPLLAEVFQLAPIGVGDWVYLFALAPVLLVADELRKWVVRRFEARKAIREIEGRGAVAAKVVSR